MLENPVTTSIVNWSIMDMVHVQLGEINESMQWSKWKLKQNYTPTEILSQLFSTQHLPIAIIFFFSWSLSAGNHYCHRQPAFLRFQSLFIYLILFRLLETFYKKFTEMQIHFCELWHRQNLCISLHLWQTQISCSPCNGWGGSRLMEMASALCDLLYYFFIQPRLLLLQIASHFWTGKHNPLDQERTKARNWDVPNYQDALWPVLLVFPLPLFAYPMQVLWVWALPGDHRVPPAPVHPPSRSTVLHSTAVFEGNPHNLTVPQEPFQAILTSSGCFTF